MIRLAVLGFAAATVLGCTDNPSMVIARNVRPSADCVIDPGNAESLFRGLLDVTSPLPDGSLNLGYVFTPVISNPVLATMSSTMNPTNPSARIIFLQGARVELLAGPAQRSQQIIATLSAANLTNRTVRFGGSIPPAGEVGVGFEVIDLEQVDLIGQLVADELVTIVVRVTVFGTRDDADIESLPFEYPITLCRGCLIQDLGSCSTIDPMAEIAQGGTCGLLQDERLSCCTTASGQSQCPAVAPMN
jgi:hypothetical protein